MFGLWLEEPSHATCPEILATCYYGTCSLPAGEQFDLNHLPTKMTRRHLFPSRIAFPRLVTASRFEGPTTICGQYVSTS
jgi:hypothetical protein